MFLAALFLFASRPGKGESVCRETGVLFLVWEAEAAFPVGGNYARLSFSSAGRPVFGGHVQEGETLEGNYGRLCFPRRLPKKGKLCF